MVSPLPAVWRPLKGRVVVKMPYDSANPGANRAWLHNHLGYLIRPEYVKGKGTWRIARPHLRNVILGLAGRFGVVHVYLDFSATQRCDTRCVEADGDDCVCQCGGENHGAGYLEGWMLVGESTLVDRRPPVLRRYLVVKSGS